MHRKSNMVACWPGVVGTPRDELYTIRATETNGATVVELKW